MNKQDSEIQRLSEALQRIASKPGSTGFIASDDCWSTALDGAQRMQGIVRDALGIPKTENACPNCFSEMFHTENGGGERCGHGDAKSICPNLQLEGSDHIE